MKGIERARATARPLWTDQLPGWHAVELVRNRRVALLRRQRAAKDFLVAIELLLDLRELVCELLLIGEPLLRHARRALAAAGALACLRSLQLLLLDSSRSDLLGSPPLPHQRLFDSLRHCNRRSLLRGSNLRLITAARLLHQPAQLLSARFFVLLVGRLEARVALLRRLPRDLHLLELLREILHCRSLLR